MTVSGSRLASRALWFVVASYTIGCMSLLPAVMDAPLRLIVPSVALGVLATFVLNAVAILTALLAFVRLRRDGVKRGKTRVAAALFLAVVGLGGTFFLLLLGYSAGHDPPYGG